MAESAHVDKLLLVNNQAFTAKYGDDASAIGTVLDALVAADAERGLTDLVLALDEAEALAPYGVAAVADSADPAQAKAAVDGLYRALTPDYLVLVGSVDVIPHQPLVNPVPDDGDPLAPSDLPYACEQGYSTDPADFIAPTRVVGRIPDLTGATDPGYLVGLLATVGDWEAGSLADYRNGFVISAEVWLGSTQLSASNLFGGAAGVRTSPDEGPEWADDVVASRSHFINCHGAGADPHFYGQRDNSYPIAHDAPYLDHRITTGTVVAAECCYGAELYDPGLADGVAGICSTYLAQGAYGFCGSSTIAYGPADGNANADLLTQYFLRDVLGGASLGRAMLQARQGFVRDVSIVDPVDLKTLAQFNLLGDPSIHPVGVPADDTTVAAAGTDTPKAMRSATRAVRRRNLAANGLALADATAVARETVEPDDQAILNELFTNAGVTRDGVAMRSFRVSEPPVATRMKAFGIAPTVPTAAAIHVIVSRPRPPSGQPASVEALGQTFAVVGLEEGGQLVSWRRLDAR